MSQNSMPMPAAQAIYQGEHMFLGLFQGTPLQRQVWHCRCYTGLPHLLQHPCLPKFSVLAQILRAASTDAPVCTAGKSCGAHRVYDKLSSSPLLCIRDLPTHYTPQALLCHSWPLQHPFHLHGLRCTHHSNRIHLHCCCNDVESGACYQCGPSASNYQTKTGYN